MYQLTIKILINILTGYTYIFILYLLIALALSGYELNNAINIRINTAKKDRIQLQLNNYEDELNKFKLHNQNMISRVQKVENDNTIENYIKNKNEIIIESYTDAYYKSLEEIQNIANEIICEINKNKTKQA